LTRQRRKLADAGLLTDTEISPGQFSTDRFGFLSRLTLLSVPGGAVPEALGYYALEALAAHLAYTSNDLQSCMRRR
ncbi:MAG TPA: hypothetical protein PK770_01680, partial [Kiritimatiellia bacterium]|nr:hypothetical protein [Kiritimatiellia bacterium]